MSDHKKGQEGGLRPHEVRAREAKLDYDDSDPYSCIAAGAWEERQSKPAPEMDRAAVLRYWWKEWNRAHDPRFPDPKAARRAAQKLRELGDAEAWERDLAAQRKNRRK